MKNGIPLSWDHPERLPGLDRVYREKKKIEEFESAKRSELGVAGHVISIWS